MTNRFPGTALLLGALALLGASSAGGDVTYRVDDLRAESPGDTGVALGALGVVQGRALLSVSFAMLGSELWTTDGTESGTSLLRDLVPGAESSSPYYAVKVPGGLFFTARTPGQGFELWWTDGTSAGTRLVSDIRAGHGDSSPVPLGVVGGAYYFSADDGIHGRELWKSNGSAAGTRLVADIRPGPESGIEDGCCAEPYGANLGHRIFFTADDGIHGMEIWRTDGTESGTIQVANIASGDRSSRPREIRSVGGRLYFSAWEPVHGRELWSSDGSPAGTSLASDVRPGPEDSDLVALTTHDGRYYFVANDGKHGRELWMSDGAPGGTLLVRDIRPGIEDGGVFGPAVGVGSRIVFAADDGVHGFEPWRSDGTANGTVLIRDLRQGSLSSAPRMVGSGLGGVLFVAAGDDLESWLWRSDGSSAGTEAIAIVPPKPEQAWIIGDLGSRAVLGLHYEGFRTSFSLLWATDGTAGGTGEVIDFVPPRSSSNPYQLLGGEDGLLFEASSDQGASVFLANRASPGARPVRTEQGQLFDGHLSGTALPDGNLVFAGGSGTTRGVWRLDDDVALPLRTSATALFSVGTEMVAAGAFGFFGATDESAGGELWRTDGTPQGTVLVRDIVPGPGSSAPYWFRSGHGRLWFFAFDESHGRELWESGGTPGTTLVHDLSPGPSPSSQEFERVTPLESVPDLLISEVNRVLFAIDPAQNLIRELHEFDPEWVYERPLQALDSRLYFFDLDPDGRCALWATDGSAAGTMRIKVTGRSAWTHSAPCPDFIARLGDRIFFTACTAAAGCELWSSDGSAAGTIRRTDLAPGTGSFLLAAPTAIGDRLYLAGCQQATGCEPWVSDGSAAGTHRLGDIWPGPRSALWRMGINSEEAWRPFVLAGGVVYFAADDGTGTELWAVPQEIFYDGFESGGTERWSAP